MKDYRWLRFVPFARTLLVDLLVDPRARPVFYYAAANVVIGVLIYHWLEGWSWLDSFYFVVITLTTIGYGDFSPTTPLTKLITVFYAINGVAILLMLFNEIQRIRQDALDDRLSRAGKDSTELS